MRMGRKRDTAEPIIAKLREAEVGLAKGRPLAEVVRKLEIAEQTYCPLAEGIRRAPPGSGEASEGARERERPAEEAGGGPGVG